MGNFWHRRPDARIELTVKRKEKKKKTEKNKIKERRRKSSFMTGI